MPVKGLMIEQIKRRLNGGNPSTAAAFREEDIAVALGQSINKRLKADYINTLQFGETIPEGCTLVTYEGDDALPVVKYGNVSKAILPVRPIKLPRDMGVYHVSRDGDLFNPFIPTQPGQAALYGNQPLINKLLGQVGYEPNGSTIVFDQDLTALEVTKVMVKLVVADVFSIDDWDPLPITPDMEADIVEEVVVKLGNKPPMDKVIDPSVVKI